MRRVSKGYTIVEVIIFLAISTILFTAAIKLINGRQTETTFNQVMQNTQSQIQTWISNVPTGFTGASPDQLHCTISGGRPTLTSAASPTPLCVFLGRAFQFTSNVSSVYADKIYAYSIFGCRLVGCSIAGQLPTNLIEAVPTPAVAGAADLTETFSVSPAKVIDVTSSAVGSSYTTSHLVGFFNSLNTEQSTATNGALDLNVYQFRFDGSNPIPGDQPGGGSLVQCLELAGNCAVAGSEKLQSLKVCISDGHQSALLTIASNYGIGATTNWQYAACS